ncbi:hypothetical protein BD779DRAFT_1521262 [Infundibulicybe gibba]|nr:hypothetical protein BD779DRAFT_1521262 [Infundibulicybe gibba]
MHVEALSEGEEEGQTGGETPSSTLVKDRLFEDGASPTHDANSPTPDPYHRDAEKGKAVSTDGHRDELEPDMQAPSVASSESPLLGPLEHSPLPTGNPLGPSPEEATPIYGGSMPSYLIRAASTGQGLSPQGHESHRPRRRTRGATHWAYQQYSGEPISKDSVSAYGFDTGETPPDLPPASLPEPDAHPQSPANPPRTISRPNKLQPTWNRQAFCDHGWVEYLLPDESSYYVHPGHQITTDVDLRDEKMLGRVLACLEECNDVAGPGQELWLRDVGSGEGGFVPLMCWVDHHERSVTSDSSEVDGEGNHHHAQHTSGDDRLDIKYRYWAFMEAHPAHASLPQGAREEVMDILTWASTVQILQSYYSASAPFTQDECQKLVALLRSLDSRGRSEEAIARHTHIVSGILLRTIHWRQLNSRPHKPLPMDACRGRPHLPEHCRPQKAILSFPPLGITVLYTTQGRAGLDSSIHSTVILAIGVCILMSAAVLGFLWILLH